ncbi:MAG: hypothetical protein FJX80_13020 [Bacteroidetes bacterium]|nr:hypothetical protein [Bacteroidota bacterium]
MAYVLTSYGEIIDKYSILNIKIEKIENASQKKNVAKELNNMSELVKEIINTFPEVKNELEALLMINKKLWKIEDDIREKERVRVFDECFIELARGVYKTNDERMRIKHRINQITHSAIFEEKSFTIL